MAYRSYTRGRSTRKSPRRSTRRSSYSSPRKTYRGAKRRSARPRAQTIKVVLQMVEAKPALPLGMKEVKPLKKSRF